MDDPTPTLAQGQALLAANPNINSVFTLSGWITRIGNIAFGYVPPAPPLTAIEIATLRVLVSGGVTPLSASRAITAADNAVWLTPTVALTLTIPAGLSPMASFTVDCPAAGAISVAVSGGATINGASTTLTRTRAANPVGFVVLAHQETDTYGVSGA